MFIHHLRSLVFRVLLLSLAVYLYIANPGRLDFTTPPDTLLDGAFLGIVWLMLAVGTLYRLFPNKRIPMGARKHFISPAVAAASSTSRKPLHKGARTVVIVWLACNAALLFGLHLYGLLTPMTAILLALFYAVCDLICILFFCPFQTFFMRNRCCAECRIYNWDYFMICTPLLLFPSAYSLSLIALAAAALVRWELAARRNPEAFQNLNCTECEDRLCLIRKPLIK